MRKQHNVDLLMPQAVGEISDVVRFISQIVELAVPPVAEQQVGARTKQLVAVPVRQVSKEIGGARCQLSEEKSVW